MALRTPIVVAASLVLGMAGAACSSDGSNDRKATTGSDPNQLGDRDRVTVAGCLNGGPDGRLVLTAAPDPGVTTAARPGMGERDTHSYVLVGTRS